MFKSLFKSTIAHRRWALFKANRRGYIAFWLFIILFMLSLCADFIANDKPILIRYDQKFYTPIFHFYSEKTFGGDFDTEADYRDPYVQQQIQAKDGWAIWPPVRYSWNSVNYDSPSLSPPSRENWFGTDDQGRDVFARLLYGYRISILFGLMLSVISSVIGIMAGAIQGYFGGKLDLFMQRILEIWSGMPLLYILIILSSIFAPGFWTLLFIMLLFSWMTLVAVVRAEFLRVRKFDYVKAARALGLSDAKIMIRHILPNALVATISMLPFIFTGSIGTLNSLDFLGFGMPPGSASLGELLQQGKNNLDYPWLALTGFFGIGVLLALATFIGEAVRDAFNPRKVFADRQDAEEAVKIDGETKTA